MRGIAMFPRRTMRQQREFLIHHCDCARVTIRCGGSADLLAVEFERAAVAFVLAGNDLDER